MDMPKIIALTLSLSCVGTLETSTKKSTIEGTESASPQLEDLKPISEIREILSDQVDNKPVEKKIER